MSTKTEFRVKVEVLSKENTKLREELARITAEARREIRELKDSLEDSNLEKDKYKEEYNQVEQENFKLKLKAGDLEEA